MNNHFLRSFVISLIVFFVVVSTAFGYSVPEYQGFVNDYAGVLSEETEQKLEEKLTLNSDQEVGVEVAVAIVETLDGDYIESVAQEFFDTWKIGKKEADNGVLLFLAIKEREIRIHTGYGAEVFLPDARSGRIIRDKIVPFLKEDNYDEAITAGVDEIIKASLGVDQEELSSSVSNKSNVSDFWGFATFFLIFFLWGMTYLAAFLGRTKSWWVGGVIGSVLGLLLAGIGYALTLGLMGLVFDYILSKNYKKWKLEDKATSWGKTMGGFHSSSSSSSSSGMTFGGGSSGGGGASGKW